MQRERGAIASAVSPAAHTAQLTEEEREALLAGADALNTLAMANDCCREHDDQARWDKAATLRRLASTAERS